MAAAASFSVGNRRIGTFLARPSGSGYGSFKSSPEDSNGSYLRRNPKHANVEEDEADRVKGSAKDYFEEAKVMIRFDGGPPPWFSPMECSGGGKRLNDAPLLIHLPGIDGVGLGLTRHHKRLGKMFDVWCLHIPVMDRTPLADMVKLVENTVQQEHSRSPDKPIYLVGESLGGCLAMVIAARNPDIDVVLILANPGKGTLDLPTAKGLSNSLIELSSNSQDDGFDIVAAIKSAGFYRRGRNHNFVADYLPPTLSDCRRLIENFRWFDVFTSPVTFSTSENGQIVRGLSGIPSRGPVVLVGNHMLMGFDTNPLLGRIFDEKKIIVRGMAHPIMFTKPGEVKLPDSSIFDACRLVGAIPVSGTNVFKLLASNSHILLYPGGAREALHRKEYQLFWPEQSEFVRLAARFGATIVPFGAVGEDDISELILGYDDFTRVPYLKKLLEYINSKLRSPRTDTPGEVANQPVHLPGVIPKLPGRLYLLFGKPIKTKGRKQELRDKQKAQELCLDVKSQVEKCIAYLKEKREEDPYRYIFPRTLYRVANGFTSEIPTLEP